LENEISASRESKSAASLAAIKSNECSCLYWPIGVSTRSKRYVVKTARTIAEQSERVAARDNEGDAQTSPELTQPMTQKKRRGDESRIVAWRWQPGKSANPGGVPKHDIAKAIAQAIFLNDPDMIHKAYTKMLPRGTLIASKCSATAHSENLKNDMKSSLGHTATSAMMSCARRSESLSVS
jgi:hypothetical protein